MKLLKSLVIFLTILIVLALGLLGYGFIKRSTDPNWRLFHTPEKSEISKLVRSKTIVSDQKKTQLKPWGHINLNLPSNCHISDFRTDGARLYLMIEPVGECQKLLVIETDTGRVLGSITPSR